MGGGRSTYYDLKDQARKSKSTGASAFYVAAAAVADPTHTKVADILDPLNGRIRESAHEDAAQVSVWLDVTGSQRRVPINFRNGAAKLLGLLTLHESFLPIVDRVPDGYTLEYRPGLLGSGKVHFTRANVGVDVWRECHLLQTSMSASPDDIWENAAEFSQRLGTENSADGAAAFGELPSELQRERSFAAFRRQLEEHLYRVSDLMILNCDLVSVSSKSGETRDDFCKRIEPKLATEKDAERARLEKQFEKKLASLDSRIKSAEARVSSQRWQFFARLGTMLWVVVDTVLSALGKGLPGRRRSLDPAFRSVASERGQQTTAQVSLDKLLDEKKSLEIECDKTLAGLDEKYSADRLALEEIVIKPRKTDIEIDRVSLVWLPFRVDRHGAATAVYEIPATTAAADEPSGDEMAAKVT